MAIKEGTLLMKVFDVLSKISETKLGYINLLVIVDENAEQINLAETTNKDFLKFEQMDSPVYYKSGDYYTIVVKE